MPVIVLRPIPAGEGPPPEPPVVPEVVPQVKRLVVEVDFLNDPNADTLPEPTWTDISEYLRVGGVSIRRGRARPVDRVEAGTASFQLDNRTRTFDPSNADGPYFPFVLPMRRIRATVVIPTAVESFVMADSYVGGSDPLGDGDVLTTLFVGNVDSWDQSFPGGGFDAVVNIRATDAFGLMTRDEVTLSATSGEPAAARIERLLDTRPYTTPRNITTESPLYMTSTTYTDTGLLGAVQEAEASEGGLFFIARDGTYTYLHRGWLQALPDIVPAFGTDEPIHDIAVDSGEELIYNRVTVTAPEDVSVTLTDAASAARYGWRTRSISTQLFSSTDAGGLAEGVLSRYASPRTAITRLDLSNMDIDWQAALRADLWDIVDVEVVLPNGDTFTQRSAIEGIELSTPHQNDWSLIWNLSAVEVWPNLLTQAQYSFEEYDEDLKQFTPTSEGWSAETNCVISSYGPYAWAIIGDYLLLADPVAAGEMSWITDEVDGITPGGYYGAAVPLLSFSSWTPYDDVHVEIDWLTSASALISTTTGATVQLPNAQYKQVGASALAPATAAKAQVRVVIEDTQTSSSIVYSDAVTFRRSA